MECLKLIARPSFAEKRIGYLGLMSLLDEKQEVLMLVTNSIQQDLKGKNQYSIGLALCALGNLCSAEMARDLVVDVKRIMRSSTIYLKKKAAICAVRLSQKAPELVRDFMDEALSLLDERSHGVLLGAVTLAVELCRLDPTVVDEFRAKLVNLIKMLKHLTTSSGSGYGSSGDHHVRGVPDPFLQVQILHLLRLLGVGSPEASDRMSDVLAQVASSTDASKNAGCAVLYECACTILEIQSTGGLKVLAVNILGKLLGHRDNNMRYVALDALVKVVRIDASAVQRHKGAILAALADGSDASTRSKAIELAFELVTAKNVEDFVAEVFNLLEDDDPQFKAKLVDKICGAVEAHAPTPTWHIATITKVLVSAGRHVSEASLRSFLAFLTRQPPSVQEVAVRHLADLFLDKSGAPARSAQLLLCVLWCVGEFGALLPDGADQVGILAAALEGQGGAEIAEVGLTALAKVGARSGAQDRQRARDVISRFNSSVDLELQARSCEFGKLFDHKRLMPEVLEAIPPLEDQQEEAAAGVPEAAPAAPVEADPMGDLLGDLGTSGGPVAAPAAAGDLLGDLLGGGGEPTATAVTPSSNPLDDLLNL